MMLFWKGFVRNHGRNLYIEVLAMVGGSTRTHKYEEKSREGEAKLRSQI